MPQTTASVKFASAMSDVQDTAAAVDQVVAKLSETFSGPIDLAMVFATGQHVDTFMLIHELLAATLSPRFEMGVTAEGVIGVRREIESGPGLSVLAASLPGAVMHAFHTGDVDWPQGDDTAALREQLVTGELAGHEPRAVIFMADPFSTPMNSMLPSLTAALGGAPVIGGMASAARAPGGNRLLLNGRLHTQGAIGLVLGGDIRVDTTVSQGCRPIARPYVITKSQRHVVMELGGKPALQVVQEMANGLGEEDRILIQSNGLLVGRVIDEYKGRFGRGDFLIRGLMGVDPKRGYVAIADPNVRVGQTIQFHVRDQKTAQEDFALLLEAQKLHGSAGGALLFSCNGRGTRLFSHKHADAAMVDHALGDVPLAGFFAAGEIGPIGDQNFVHGHTASLAVLRSTAEQPEPQ